VINLVTTVIGIIIVQYFLVNTFNLRYVKPDWQSIKHELFEGWHVFISTIAISMYTISNSFFLGIMTSATMVAYYASGEKIMNAVQGLLGPVSQALYPHLTKIVHNDKSEGIKAIQQALFRIAGVGLIISLGLFVAAPVIVRLLFGVKYQIATTEVVRILSVLPFIICLSNVFGIQTMLPFGLTKPFSRILIISSILNVVLLLILIPRYSYVGTAISVVITEVSVTSMMLFYLFKNGIYVWRGKLISKEVNYG
jgi:PST family polysaccharide transporter